MKTKFIAIAMMVASLAACDDSTDNIGTSLIDKGDNLEVVTDTFDVASRTVIADSVVTRSVDGYLGRLKDPETGDYLTGNYMVQLNTLSDYELPAKANVLSQWNGDVAVDSVDIRLYYSTIYGDSLSQMKLTAYEMAKPMEEGAMYFSNYDPIARGYIREDGLRQDRSYTLEDFSERDSIKHQSGYQKNINIRLNKPYTDKNGVSYNNYGTYLMRKYYENPANFKNSYLFLHNVCPGFYFKMTGGVGSMAKIGAAQLNIYFKYHDAELDTTYEASSSFAATEEVLQTTTFENDVDVIRQLAADGSCTYLKTPSGLFTELTMPVENIMTGHENDSLNTVRMRLQRMNNSDPSAYSFALPDYLLILPEDSLQQFFVDSRVPDYKTSFLGQYEATSNSYVFHNVQGMVAQMWRRRGSSANWNKAIVVPVTVSTSTDRDNHTAITKVENNMTPTSTRLVGGTDGKGKIKVSVIYGRFNGR